MREDAFPAPGASGKHVHDGIRLSLGGRKNAGSRPIRFGKRTRVLVRGPPRGMRAERQQKQQDEEGDQQLGDGHATGVIQDRGAATAKRCRLQDTEMAQGAALSLSRIATRRAVSLGGLLFIAVTTGPTAVRGRIRPLVDILRAVAIALAILFALALAILQVAGFFIVFLGARGHRRSPDLGPVITNAAHSGFRPTHHCSARSPPPRKCLSLRQRP